MQAQPFMIAAIYQELFLKNRRLEQWPLVGGARASEAVA
jgi:hypothetical protein